MTYQFSFRCAAISFEFNRTFYYRATKKLKTSPVGADVVPAASIASFEGKDYIFVSSDSNQFRSMRVTIGNSVGEFTEVQLLEKIAARTPAVTKVAFELIGLLKNNNNKQTF